MGYPGDFRFYPSPTSWAWGGTLVHSRVECKQLESVGHLALGYVRKGQGWGFSPNPLPSRCVRTLMAGPTDDRLNG